LRLTGRHHRDTWSTKVPRAGARAAHQLGAKTNALTGQSIVVSHGWFMQ
jgi:hypothetical protein